MELSGLIGFMMAVDVRMLNVEFVVHLLLHEYDDVWCSSSQCC